MDLTRYVFCEFMLIKIDRQEAIRKFPILPLRHYDKKKDEEVFNGPTVFANYVLTLPLKSYRGNQKMLGTQITLLAKNLGYDHLVFLGDTEIPWLKRLNTHESFQEALGYLAENNIGKRFKGALQVDRDELPTFVKNLTWLVRTNGIVQYVHFTDAGQNMVANICQYGNLHVSTKHATADDNVKNAIARSTFTYLTNASCFNKFSKNGIIKGRITTA